MIEKLLPVQHTEPTEAGEQVLVSGVGLSRFTSTLPLWRRVRCCRYATRIPGNSPAILASLMRPREI